MRKKSNSDGVLDIVLKVPGKRRGLTKQAPDAGILRSSQIVFYAVTFFWLDGFAVPPAQVSREDHMGQAASRWAFQKYSQFFHTAKVA